MFRFLSLFLFAVAVTAFVAAPVLADDKAKNEEQEKDKAKNSHVGTFVNAKGSNEFTMKAGDKEHSHTLAADAKIVGPDGKDIKLDELKAGQRIRVTTKEGDMKTATRVEVMKEK